MAVSQYVKYRGTRDIDLVVAGSLNPERLVELGYRRREGHDASWYTPRGIQADFYTKDLAKIPASWILDTAVPINIGKKKIRVICLEGLILAKHRAGRTQDTDDLRQLFASRGQEIRWDTMSQIATGMEIMELQKVARAFESHGHLGRR